MKVLINPYGEKVCLPDAWECLYSQDFIDACIEPEKYIFNPLSPNPPKLWIERMGGGFGDVVHALPAITIKAREFRQEHGNFARIYVSVPEHHVFMLEHLRGLEIIPVEKLDQLNYYKSAFMDAREHCNLFCPADDYEHESHFNVQKSRVELFAEACRIKGVIESPMMFPRCRIDNPFPEGKQVVGICLRSIDRYKDWTFDKWREVCLAIQKMGYFVFTIDSRINLEGIPAITYKKMPEVYQYLSWCDAILGPDTGPIFLAAAMGVTTIGLFGKTSGYQLLEKNYLNGHAVQVLRPDRCQRPCYHDKTYRGFYCDVEAAPSATTTCMEDITVKMVLEAFEVHAYYGELGDTRFDRGGVQWQKFLMEMET